MKTVRVSERSKHRLLHVEAPGCIVNIRHGLTNMEGQAVTSVEIIPDGQLAGEDYRWQLADDLKASGVNVRVVQLPTE